MTGQTLQPRACPPTAWLAWARDGFQILRRGAAVWLPIEILVVCLGSASLLAWPMVFLVLPLIHVPLFGVQTAVADTLAEGNCRLADLLGAIGGDLRKNGRAYISAMLVRAVCWAAWFFLLMTVVSHLPSPKPAHPLTESGISSYTRIWFGVWWLGQGLRFGGCLGFYPWLRYRWGMPALEAASLDARAALNNRTSMRSLTFYFMVAGVLLWPVPWSAVLIQPLWAAIVRCAYADIFDDGAGLRAIKKVAATPQLLPRLAARAHGHAR